eukprot:Rhum_TRINITY_DN7695_c0_g1::Rhum_TRINITY_DN7695_c0_g1_i1::g.24253::m.24253
MVVGIRANLSKPSHFGIRGIRSSPTAQLSSAAAADQRRGSAHDASGTRQAAEEVDADAERTWVALPSSLEGCGDGYFSPTFVAPDGPPPPPPCPPPHAGHSQRHRTLAAAAAAPPPPLREGSHTSSSSSVSQPNSLTARTPARQYPPAAVSVVVRPAPMPPAFVAPAAPAALGAAAGQHHHHHHPPCNEPEARVVSPFAPSLPGGYRGGG